MSRDESRCPKGLAKGVILEILWDIERHPMEGRRAREKVTESVWWRTEVLEVTHEWGRVVATVKYDSMHGFKSQNAQLYVFPYHVHPIDEREVTHLRWRFFESSGNPRSDFFGGDGIHGGHGSHIEEGGRFAMMKQRIDELSGRIQHVERLAVSEREVFTQVSRSLRTDDDRVGGLLALLRQKLAFSAQKPLTHSKNRNGDPEDPLLIDYSCTGSLSAVIDCTADDFEALCQSIRNQCSSVQFRADKRSIVPSVGSMKTSTSVAEVLFASLKDLSQALCITQRTDRMAIAWRRKCAVSNACPKEVALRFCGTFFSERWRNETPSAILVCQSVHENIEMNSEVVTLTREDRKLDSISSWYRKPLRLERLPISEAMAAVFNATVDGEPEQLPLNTSEYAYLVRNLTQRIDSFALRWKPLASLNSKIWTRKITTQSALFGTLEVVVPYLFIRSDNAVSEIESLLSKDIILGVIN